MSSDEAFSRTKLLQSKDDVFIRFVLSRARQFAVLGYAEVAKNIISRLNSSEKYRDTRSAQSLWLLWASLGEWPAGEEGKIKQKIEARKGEEHRDQTGVSEESVNDVNEEVQLMEGVYADTWLCDARKTIFTGTSNLQEVEALENNEIAKGIKSILKSIEKLEPSYLDAETGSAAMSASMALVGALHLRCLLKEREYEEDGIASVQELLERIGKRMSSNCQLDYLTKSRKIWVLLKEGLLAEAVGVDSQKVHAYAKELEETVDERMRSGKEGLKHLPMKNMLEALDYNSRTNPESFEDDPDEIRESLFRPPASQKEIETAEKDLGIALPEDYKEFLSITNGFGQVWRGILFEPPLHPLSEIRWFDDDEDYFIDLELELFESELPYDVWPIVGKAIEIGTEDIDNIWLIPPPKVQEVKDRISEVLLSSQYTDRVKKSVVRAIEDFTGSVEEFMKLDWCLATWASGGSVVMRSYPSFTAYLRDNVEKSASESSDGLDANKFFGYQCR